MDWKNRLKWKILIILFAVCGMIIIWCVNRAENKWQMGYREEQIREKAIQENEYASLREYDKEVNVGEEEQAEKSFEGEDKTEITDQTQISQDEPEISVLLMTDGYSSYTHPEAVIQFQGRYLIKGSTEAEYGDGQILSLSENPELFKDGSIRIEPQEENGRAVFLSLDRQQGNPVYRGKFTVYQEEEGFRIINTLPLEEYLYGVLPSEMPASYGTEALKAQAVCARTYAWVQLQNSGLRDLDAQVDDSVAYQVYQNVSEAESAKQAVDETKGEILTSDGAPITAYYFSTSSGKTSTDQVWEAAVPAAYLKSVPCQYDASEPWHTWSLIFSMDRLTEQACKKYPDVNTVYGMKAEQLYEQSVMRLVLDTDAGEKILSNEYDIRELLSPEGTAITRQDGSEVKGGSLLPSAYFTLEENRDEAGDLKAYVITGSGYGHGVGLSQNGAKGMAEQGMGYQEILNYFYNNIEITNIF